MLSETRRPLFGRVVLGTLAVGATLAATACGSLPLLPPALQDGGETVAPEPTDAAAPTVPEEPTETSEPASPVTVDVFSLEVGDCFIESEVETALFSEGVSEVPLVDCSQEHDSEFFYSHQLTDASYPGDSAVQTEADEVCKGENFTDFIGVDYLDSEIYSYYLTPTQQSWDQANDREIICYATTANIGETVTGTLEDANR
ncbi:septum formation family protein [Nocardiopsis sp. HUAS JQ3]|uniref:septum formation family protein n=1 Tax=Nocardiopsis sp. HUAS JQ3 TaxID=3061629 RepID=UPI0023A96798|nr:septum formation family protein [Nocardiopsis sp. HUAS JQ3]WDZ92160.1 septum formation family protein [Nocardiopsis sp. HUAS JQ3]